MFSTRCQMQNDRTNRRKYHVFVKICNLECILQSKPRFFSSDPFCAFSVQLIHFTGGMFPVCTPDPIYPIYPIHPIYPSTIQLLSNHYSPLSNHYPTTIHHYPTTIHHYPTTIQPLSPTKQPLSNHYMRTNRTNISPR